MKTFLYVVAFIALHLYVTTVVFMDIRGDYYSREPVALTSFNPQSLHELPVYRDTSLEVQCLAKNIYHEARNQSVDGMYAVAYVTINRMAATRYPDTICKVVYEPYQFSWTHQNKKLNLNNKIEVAAWKVAVDVAVDAMHNDVPLDMLNVMNYHANYVNPRWTARKRRHSEIQDHIFYTAL